MISQATSSGHGDGLRFEVGAANPTRVFNTKLCIPSLKEPIEENERETDR